MNTARQVAYVNPQSYLDVSNESMIQISDTSSLSLLQAYPKWILYTSLGGSTLSYGTIRQAVKIRESWIANLVTKLNEVDLDALWGITSPPVPQSEPIKHADEPELEK